MSYDLMVFDPQAPPANREGFLKWFEQQTEWAEDHSYDDPGVSTASLRSWFLDMIKVYPPMNGPHASDDVDDPRVTDYSVGQVVVYAAFAWSEADAARKAMFSLASEHGVGFFDVSVENGGVWMPSADGKFELQHGG